MGMDISILAAAGGIALVDLVLSGDNALVIGAAAGKLPRRERPLAIGIGGLGAIVLRLILALVATIVLKLPYVQLLGGLVVFVVAVRLLFPEGENPYVKRTSKRWFSAVLTIIVADITMSLDNVIAVAALAHGVIALLVIGLVLSMALLFFASSLIAGLMERFPLLLDLAGVVLAWTAASLVLGDPLTQRLGAVSAPLDLGIHIIATLGLLITDVALRLRRGRSQPRALRRATAVREGVREGAGEG